MNKLNGIVSALTEAGKNQAIAQAADIAVGIAPNCHLGHLWAGVALRALGKYNESTEALELALKLAPDDPVTMANLGSVLADSDTQRAIELLRRAMTLDPGEDFIVQNYMLLMLSSGDLERGWNLYNRRTRFPAVNNQICKYPETIDGHPGVWDGRTPGRVLVVGEEGIGERIMFASMLADMRKVGAEVLFELTSGFERFRPWFERSLPNIKIVSGGESQTIDYHINVGDLGHLYRRTEADFPKHKGYMTWDKARAAKYRKRLSPGPIIGVCWKSMANAGPYKSVGLDKMRPILSVPGATFVDIQYLSDEKERNKNAPLLNHIPDLDFVKDMDGVAALIGACDLIVTVSSVTAHMAGAMGKPVWMLTPGRTGRMWFWFLGREDSPWYPSMRLYRQSSNGDWSVPVARIASDLTEFVASWKK